MLWAGVRCAAEVAATREAARGDRRPGMAAQQALTVHHGIRYDVEVDTTATSPAAAVRALAAALHNGPRRQ